MELICVIISTLAKNYAFTVAVVVRNFQVILESMYVKCQAISARISARYMNFVDRSVHTLWKKNTRYINVARKLVPSRVL